MGRRVTLTLDARTDDVIGEVIERGRANNQTEAINRLCSLAGGLLRYTDAHGEIVVLDADGQPVRMLLL